MCSALPNFKRAPEHVENEDPECCEMDAFFIYMYFSQAHHLKFYYYNICFGFEFMNYIFF